MPLLLFSQHKKYSKHKIDHPVFSFGPGVSGNIFVGGNIEEKPKIYFKYTIGGFMVLRPLERFGLEAEFNYGKWIKSYSFYEVPVVIQVYYNQDSAIKFGPIFTFPHLNANNTNKDMLIGLRLGFGNQLAGAHLDFSKNVMDFEIRDGFAFLIGIGLNLRLSVMISRK